MRTRFPAAFVAMVSGSIAAAGAQGTLVRDAVPVPNVALRAPGSSFGADGAGVSWRQPMKPAIAQTIARLPVKPRPRPAAPAVVARPPATATSAAVPTQAARPVQPVSVGGFAPAARFNAYPGYRAIQIGGMVPTAFSGTRYDIDDHERYGFRQPAAGYRWMRYYDDALLIDGRGRVADGRYGMDFDRYGDDWGRDGRGVPIYVGRDDFDDRDDAFDDQDRRERFARDRLARDRFDRRRVERDERGALGYDRDYPYDYRYGGEGYRGGYTVTETTTTTAPRVVRRVVYD